MTPRALLIEDDETIAEPLVEGLGRYGLTVGHVATGTEGLQGPYGDIVLLDLGLPDMDGIDVCRGIRQVSDVPIIMLTARGTEADRVLGLELGADDYLAKPFSVRELIARIRAVTRRSAAWAGAAPTGMPSMNPPGMPSMNAPGAFEGTAAPIGVEVTNSPGAFPYPERAEPPRTDAPYRPEPPRRTDLPRRTDQPRRNDPPRRNHPPRRNDPPATAPTSMPAWQSSVPVSVSTSSGSTTSVATAPPEPESRPGPAASEADGAWSDPAPQRSSPTGALIVDRRTRQVWIGDTPIALTPKEFDLLALLTEDPGAVYSRQQILDRVWDPHFHGPTKTLDVHVATLRRKLGNPAWIQTLRGVGLRLAVRTNSDSPYPESRH